MKKVIVNRNPNITIVTTTTTTTTITNGRKPRIHNIFIIDASGSMDSNRKYSIAIGGLNELLYGIKNDTDSENTVMIVEFEGRNIVTRLPITSTIPSSYKGMGTGGLTPLNQAVGETLEAVLDLRATNYSVDDKVLVNVFTDGGENESQGKYKGAPGAAYLGKLILDLEDKGFTITFVGTQTEVNYAINTLSLKASNTMVHANTASTVKAAFDTTVRARAMYSKSVSLGEDVKEAFYTKTLLRTEEEETK
jgi:Mg-chelatase subunit ChlD